MNQDPSNQPANQPVGVEQVAKQALDASVDSLPPEIRRRLNQARHAAIQTKTTQTKSGLTYWKAASAVSFTLALTLGWQLWPGSDPLPPEPFAEVLDEDLDMLEDLEFVYWVAEAGLEESGFEEVGLKDVSRELI